MHGPRAATHACTTGLLLLVVVTGLACGGPPKRSFDGSTFRSGPVAFQVPPAPQGWRAVDVTQGSLAYRDDAHGASILLNGRCHRPDEATPLLALTNHLLMGSTAREIVSQETIPFDGREALHTRLRAKWDGVPIAFDIYVTKKDGCTYDFVYMGDPTAYEEGTRAFGAFVAGFRTLPGSGLIAGPRG
ncbi:MAG TPA: hypothetical protein VLT33_00290 [Labilithrix sp.]|nr:hypothetical protein [Labilithrix sp.]